MIIKFYYVKASIMIGVCADYMWMLREHDCV